MYRILMAGLIVLGAFAGGVWLGYRAGGTECAKRALKSAQQQVQGVTSEVQRRINEQAHQSQIDVEQSTALLAGQQLIRARADTLQQEIVHVDFQTQLVTPACAASMDAAGLGSDDFQRLYDAAARGGAAATAPPGAHPDRVPAGGTGVVPNHADPPAG